MSRFYDIVSKPARIMGKSLPSAAPTAANFVFCDLGEDAAAVALFLREEGVAVKPLGSWGAPNSIRVTIGTPEQNQALLQAMRRVGARKTATESRFSSLA